jgi:hypothetical protein
MVFLLGRGFTGALIFVLVKRRWLQHTTVLLLSPVLSIVNQHKQFPGGYPVTLLVVLVNYRMVLQCGLFMDTERMDRSLFELEIRSELVSSSLPQTATKEMYASFALEIISTLG